MFDIIYPKVILAAAEGGDGNSDCAIATVVVDCWSYHWILQTLPLPLLLEVCSGIGSGSSSSSRNI